jgi:ubiquinol-cytochrome c reductase cytochrome b subunit
MASLHVRGSRNPVGLGKVLSSVSFQPLFTLKDAVAWGAVICLIGGLIFFFPDWLGDPDNYREANPMVTPSHIQPEWYFLFAYAILRRVPNRLGGVVLMGVSLLVLVSLVLVYVERVSSKLSSLSLLRGALFGTVVLSLSFLGGRVAAYPYTLFRGVLSVIYFLAFFLLIVLGGTSPVEDRV